MSDDSRRERDVVVMRGRQRKCVSGGFFNCLGGIFRSYELLSTPLATSRTRAFCLLSSLSSLFSFLGSMLHERIRCFDIYRCTGVPMRAVKNADEKGGGLPRAGRVSPTPKSRMPVRSWARGKGRGRFTVQVACRWAGAYCTVSLQYHARLLRQNEAS